MSVEIDRVERDATGRVLQAGQYVVYRAGSRLMRGVVAGFAPKMIRIIPLIRIRQNLKLPSPKLWRYCTVPVPAAQLVVYNPVETSDIVDDSVIEEIVNSRYATS